MRVIEKLPSPSEVAVPKTTSPLNSVTFELASAVPLIVGVGSFESEIFFREEGACGAVVSIVMDIEEDSEEVLSTESVAVALTVYSPSLRAEVTVIEKFPLLSVVVVSVATKVDPLNIFKIILESGSALPVIVGVESLVSEV